MGRRTLRVFLSRTDELAKYPRDQSFVAAAKDAVNRAGGTPVEMKNFYASGNQDPASYCKQRLEATDVYVGIIGFRYGTIVLEDRSYTELEFDTAGELRLPRLVYLLDGKTEEPMPLPPSCLSDPDPELNRRQKEFRARIENAEEWTPRFVTTPQQLTTELLDALNAQLQLESAPSSEPLSSLGLTATLPVLADDTQKQLRSTMALLQDAVRAMEQVEHGYAKSAGMDKWRNWDDKQKKHSELANSATGPAIDLKSRLEEAFKGVENVRGNVEELRVRWPARRTTELTSITDMLSDLQDASRDLVERVRHAQEELEERASDYPNYYEAPRELISQACDLIERTNARAVRMRRSLSRLKEASEIAQRRDTSQAGEQRDQDVSPVPHMPSSLPTRTPMSAVRDIEADWTAAAGAPTQSAGKDSNSVPVPSEPVSGSRIAAVKVQGDSMEGAGVRDGDYVIVDGQRVPQDRDIVVITIEGTGPPEDREAIVKRLRLRADGTLLRLESANPDRPAKNIKPEDNPVIVGKVIGIFRPVP